MREKEFVWEQERERHAKLKIEHALCRAGEIEWSPYGLGRIWEKSRERVSVYEKEREIKKAFVCEWERESEYAKERGVFR